jgi:hypothetical protein
MGRVHEEAVLRAVECAERGVLHMVGEGEAMWK